MHNPTTCYLLASAVTIFLGDLFDPDLGDLID